jgi:hypothetical protein
MVATSIFNVTKVHRPDGGNTKTRVQDPSKLLTEVKQSFTL